MWAAGGCVYVFGPWSPGGVSARVYASSNALSTHAHTCMHAFMAVRASARTSAWRRLQAHMHCGDPQTQTLRCSSQFALGFQTLAWQLLHTMRLHIKCIYDRLMMHERGDPQTQTPRCSSQFALGFQTLAWQLLHTMRLHIKCIYDRLMMHARVRVRAHSQCV